MIKILTLLGNNYGGCLQAVALQKVLNNYTDKVVTINYKEYLDNKKNIKEFIKKFVYYKRNKNFELFRRKNLILTEPISKIEDDKKSTYIVGSDQIWNPNINYSIRKNFYLSFVNEKNRKYSYAASVGADVLDFNNSDEIIDMLNDFEMISIREKSAKKLLNNLSVPIYEVLDPTLLLTSSEWDNYKSSIEHKNNYVFIYMLGVTEQISNLINKEVKEDIMEISFKKHFNKTKYLQNNYGPAEFISAVANSNFVITNSFHGMVFSIIYHKNFYVILRDSMNSRIYDLLENLGLLDRIISDDKSYFGFEKQNPINWNQVDKKIDKLREKSFDYINKIFKEK